MPKQQDDYLSLEEQALVLNKIRAITFNSPREATLIEKGPVFAGGAVFFSGIVFWRCAFRGFNLARYGRRRIVTAVMPVLASLQGATTHSYFVSSYLNDMFRDENHWTFGLRSALAHQPGLFGSFVIVTAFTFWHAHEIGVVPTQRRIIVKGARMEAFKIYLSKLKPYRSPLALTWAISTAFMFTIGLLEYRQSRTLLAKVNRKTLGRKEG